MSRSAVILFLLFSAEWAAIAQTGVGPLSVGNRVHAPRPKYAPEPNYSEVARQNGIQGTVVLTLVVDEKGRTTDIVPICPLGYGLDDQAIAAVEKWRFSPGTKDGKPVSVPAKVEVSFRLLNHPIDARMENNRASYNGAIQVIQGGNASPEVLDAALKRLHDLAAEEFPPAMYAYGALQIRGQHMQLDVSGGLRLIEDAASKNYAPALYAIGMREIEGKDGPPDVVKGIGNLQKASEYGGDQAQRELAHRYETGVGVESNPDQALHYYRLCASGGVAQCQLLVGKLMLASPQAFEAMEQAVAWLQLAGEKGIPEAADLASTHMGELTLEQITEAKRLEARFSRK